MFFFEKKNQKMFVCSLARVQADKSLFASISSEKEETSL
jgi:hypothetical protein